MAPNILGYNGSTHTSQNGNKSVRQWTVNSLLMSWGSSRSVKQINTHDHTVHQMNNQLHWQTDNQADGQMKNQSDKQSVSKGITGSGLLLCRCQTLDEWQLTSLSATYWSAWDSAAIHTSSVCVIEKRGREGGVPGYKYSF